MIVLLRLAGALDVALPELFDPPEPSSARQTVLSTHLADLAAAHERLTDAIERLLNGREA